MTEIALDVTGVHRLGKVRRMTRIAICILQLIIPTLVTLDTRQSGVRSAERECSARMAERRRAPERCAMALSARV